MLVHCRLLPAFGQVTADNSAVPIQTTKARVTRLSTEHKMKAPGRARLKTLNLGPSKSYNEANILHILQVVCTDSQKFTTLQAEQMKNIR